MSTVRRASGGGVLVAAANRGGVHDPWRDLSIALALATLFLLGARMFVGRNISIGLLLALAIVPVWIMHALRGKRRVSVMVSFLATVVSALWLTANAAPTHVVDIALMFSMLSLYVTIPVTIGVLLWAGTLVPMWVAAGSYSAGLVLSAFLRPSLFLENPWKYAIGLPVAALLLSIAMAFRSRQVEIAALLLLAAASAGMDSRSFFGVFALVALLTFWQMLPRLSRRRASALTVLAWVGALALIIYVVGTSLLLEGYLGETAQQRSIEQQERAGSVIVGGRPEMAATAALFLHRPIGFGPGILITPTELLAVKGGMRTINYDPENGWVEQRLFGDSIELHSVIGDVWAHLGIPGLLFLLVVLVILAHRTAADLAERNASALLLFTVAISVWNLAFNPIYSSAPFLALAIALSLASPEETPQYPASLASRQATRR